MNKHLPKRVPKQSRSALVGFFNDVLQLDVQQVEQLGDGAAYCQLMDAVFGDMPMNRVVFDATTESQKETNFKLLQYEFLKHKIAYNFDPTRLMKCKLQDNLEFSQWCFQFWHQQERTIEGYNPRTVREQSRLKAMPSVRQMRSLDPNTLGTAMQSRDRMQRKTSAQALVSKRVPSTRSFSAQRTPAVQRVPAVQRAPSAQVLRGAPSIHRSSLPPVSPRAQYHDVDMTDFSNGDVSAYGELREEEIYDDPPPPNEEQLQLLAKIEALQNENARLVEANSDLQQKASAEHDGIVSLSQEILSLQTAANEISHTADIAIQERDTYYEQLRNVLSCIDTEIQDIYGGGDAPVEEPLNEKLPLLRTLRNLIEHEPVADDEPF